jgi:hypothetical protein
VPFLAERILRNGNIRIAQVDLKHRDPNQPVFARRIFPSGGAFLLPDSLVLKRPEVVAHLLRWFRYVKLPHMAMSKWKFVVRPAFRTWIREIIDNERSLRRPHELEPFKKILYELMSSIPEESWDERDSRKTPLEGGNSPMAAPYLLPGYGHGLGTEVLEDRELLKSNDSKLVQWFGAWTLERIDKHRKFYVLFDGFGLDPAIATTTDWAKSWLQVSLTTRNKCFLANEMIQINVVPPIKFEEWENVKRDVEKHEESRKKGLAKKSPREPAWAQKASSKG